MSTQESLRNTVAEFFGTSADNVAPNFPLAGARLEGSVARGLLDAAIRRRVGVKCQAVYTAKSYGELEAAVLGKPMEPGDLSAVASSRNISTATMLGKNAASAVQCGVDIELVDNLPEASDCWEHDFYKTHFAPSEIAYCLMQPNPRMHFTARWCAKESLKKCDPAFLTEDMNRIALVADAAGALSLQFDRNGTMIPLPHAVSISHTPSSAVAVVVWAAESSKPAPLPQPAPIVVDANRRSSLPAIALAALALLLALIALWRTIR